MWNRNLEWMTSSEASIFLHVFKMMQTAEHITFWIVFWCAQKSRDSLLKNVSKQVSDFG